MRERLSKVKESTNHATITSLRALCLERFALEANTLVGTPLICLGLLRRDALSGYPLSLDTGKRLTGQDLS